MGGFKIIHDMFELIFASPDAPFAAANFTFPFEESQLPGDPASVTGVAHLICQRFSAVLAG